MTPIEARQGLERALKAAGSDLKNASEALGHNHAYLQQFISLGKPRYLHEQDRERLAELYNIDVQALKPPPKKSVARVGVRSAAATRTRPRPGDPVEDSREADIVYAWRQLPKEDQDVLFGMLDGLLLRHGLPTIAA